MGSGGERRGAMGSGGEWRGAVGSGGERHRYFNDREKLVKEKDLYFLKILYFNVTGCSF